MKISSTVEEHFCCKWDGDDYEAITLISSSSGDGLFFHRALNGDLDLQEHGGVRSVDGEILGLSGDGVEEIVLGAPYYTVYDHRGAGAAWILRTTDLLGTSAPDDFALARIQGRALDVSDMLGSSLSHGDFNRDGQTDLLIGADEASVPDGSDGRGVAYGFYTMPRGAVTAWTEADFQIYSTADTGQAAYALSADMDLDLDGCDDILISEPNWPDKSDGYGVVGIFLGGCE